ncbi:hypothetical protein C0995_008790 [Termitomyces sp. Mi166|nr:hypothetical protein C0995_008790 [Termitomyces sp. Mi166\
MCFHCSEDGAVRTIDDPANFGLVHPSGTNLRSTELAPGSITVMGELVLITEDGTEKHLKNPGDMVIQKGTMHAWRNPTDKWTRWITVLIAAEAAIPNGEPLGPAILPVPSA